MTPEQQALMIRIFQFGFSTGSTNRFDCLRSYIRAYPEQEETALAAATEFEKGCCYSHEAAEKLKQMEPYYFKQWLMNY